MTVAEPIPAEAPPLYRDEDGVIRVGATRVALESIMGDYLDGAAPEQIAMDYDAVSLSDVYATIAYCLRHRAEVQVYLAHADERADSVRRENEARWPAAGVLRRLLERRERSGSPR